MGGITGCGVGWGAGKGLVGTTGRGVGSGIAGHGGVGLGVLNQHVCGGEASTRTASVR